MKRYLILISLIILFFIVTAPIVYARSYNIDEVRIRAWIQPNGDLLVNEIFTYTFKGKYDRVQRFIHEDHHYGVRNFESYELINSNAEIGYVTPSELRLLPVSEKENGYYSSLSVENEQKYIFYTYTLAQAVKSFATYSDLTVPFFGGSTNHDEDYSNVTIDFVFPREVDPEDYYAYFHDRNGAVEQKGPSVVRFKTSVSEMYSLTETRLLFPSEVMSGQAKANEPMSLEAALAKENQYMHSLASKKQHKEKLGYIFIAFAILLTSTSICMVLLPQRRQGTGNPNELLNKDPLHLYLLDRLGKKDSNAFLAGLYSLVEKGFVSVSVNSAHGRFQRDPEAPDQTLLFILTADEHMLSDSERKLVKALFKNRGAKHQTFLLYDIAGATKKEKEEKVSFRSYISKIHAFKIREQQWWDDVIAVMKAEGIMSNRIPLILKGLLSISAFASMIYAYILDSLDGSSISLYGISALIILIISLRKSTKRWPFILFWGVTLFANLMLQDADLLFSLFLFITSSIALISVTPRMILSRDAAEVYRSIKLFRKQMNAGGIPTHELEKWMVRSQLLRTKPQAAYENTAMELAATAPFAYLMMSGQNPITYMVDSWKMTMPYGSSASGSGSSGYSGDGGYSGGDSGGGGGDGGGGAGAD
ncbi:DUF2207 domain-containing protein [Candidatus Pristimantibacillus sp. PTI5]|uniref:DUF2207 domain-containing protein n=1 Tax=Candidatus Pristimantibacillus sp. PTI5 TaxID=3400422 RepID=UPI003B026DB6